MAEDLYQWAPPSESNFCWNSNPCCKHVLRECVLDLCKDVKEQELHLSENKTNNHDFKKECQFG